MVMRPRVKGAAVDVVVADAGVAAVTARAIVALPPAKVRTLAKAQRSGIWL